MTGVTAATTVDDERERRRIAQIDAYGLLHAAPRADLVALAEVAALVADVPMATVNLITDAEQHQIATAGFEASICAREDSMCAVVLDEAAPVIVADASLDPRFRDNPFVTGEIGRVRFYATHQLRTPSGVAIGSLCVFDLEPRTIDAEQRRALRGLADRVVDLLELELRTRELHATVEALRTAQAELERSNERLAAFAGQVSHDLRNPLGAILMALGLLVEELPGAASTQLGFLLDRALRATRRMQALIDDLLAFARLGGELNQGDVDLGEVTEAVLEDLAPVLAGAVVEVGVLPTVRGDAVQLRAVVQNLLANAAKFARPGEPARIELRAERGEGAWRVEVLDHGIGVAPAERERVFAPLARVAETQEGSGIGLATCRRVIEAHGGRIGLAEGPDGGTCAWFELPA